MLLMINLMSVLNNRKRLDELNVQKHLKWLLFKRIHKQAVFIDFFFSIWVLKKCLSLKRASNWCVQLNEDLIVFRLCHILGTPRGSYKEAVHLEASYVVT